MVAVKICGLSTHEALGAALDAGADYVGLVFFDKSPRHVTLNQATELAHLARGRAKIVALTVDASDAQLTDIADAVSPDIIQVHGSEDASRTQYICQHFGAPVLKAFKIRNQNDVAAARSFLDKAVLPLFDAKPPENAQIPGGNGEVFDWTLLKAWPSSSPFMLSGGLNIENVKQGIAATGAPMIDLSSGVETAPGIKDPDLIKDFIKIAKA